MSVYTNRGLKLRLDTAFVFALIARLAPRYDAFTVFQCTEAIECSPSFYFFTSAILTMSLSTSPLALLLIPPICATLQALMKLARAYTPLASLLMPLFRCYSLLQGYAILALTLFAVAYLRMGVHGLLALLGAYLIASFILKIIENAYARWWLNHNGRLIWSPEHSFIYAFQFLAHKIGVNARTSVTDEEKDAPGTLNALARLAVDYPKIVSRFDDDYITHQLNETQLQRYIIDARVTPHSPVNFPSPKILLRLPVTFFLIATGFFTSLMSYSIPVGFVLSILPAWCFRIPFPFAAFPMLFIHQLLYLSIFKYIFNKLAKYPFFFHWIFNGHHLCFSLLLGFALAFSLSSTFPPIARYCSGYTAPGINLRFASLIAIMTMINYCAFLNIHKKVVIPRQFSEKYPQIFT